MTAALDWIANILGQILAFFYGIFPSLGVAIILLVIVVMLVLFPLTAKQARSMMEMQRLQPKIKELQKQHKEDRQKLNEETMKLFQEHQVNPFMGCLPLVLQMPFFFGLFRLLHSPVSHIPVNSKLYDAFCHNVTKCTGKNANALEFLGMNLKVTALSHHGGVLTALPYFVLVGLVAITSLIQIQQNKRVQKGAANAQMQLMMTILPIGFALFSLRFPAGLVLYFFVSNLWRIGQQEIILRKITMPGLKEAGMLKTETTSETTNESPADPGTRSRKRKKRK